MLFDGGRADDRRGMHGHIGQKRRIFFLEGYLDGLGIHHPDFLDHAKGKVGIAENAGVVLRMFWIDLPIDRKLDRLGVKRRSIVECNSFS